MEAEIDLSDESDAHAASAQTGGRQGLVDRCVTLILQVAIRNPGAPAPQMIETLLWAGPLQGKQALIELFRGRAGLLTTIWGLEAARRALREGELGSLPVTTRAQEGWPVGYTIPGAEQNIRCVTFLASRFSLSWATNSPPLRF